MSDAIRKLQELFSDFPTIGSRTASRFVFYILSLPKEKVSELANALMQAKQSVKSCAFCFNLHQENGSLCSICQNTTRDSSMLCVVEKEADLESIEKTKHYKGLYFVLGGSATLKKDFGQNLKIQELKERLENPQKFGIAKARFQEIIIATNPTPEGNMTSLAVEKSLKDYESWLKVTHLAKGIPVGGELEYADEETLESAFKGRK